MLTGAARHSTVGLATVLRARSYALLYYEVRGRELLLMTPVGETLRRERMKRNLDLEEISRELKISTRFLQAIENDQYEKLPGGVFAKSFVRQYARLLSLNEDDLAVQVQEILGPVVEPPQLAESKPSGVAPIHVPKVDEW